MIGVRSIVIGYGSIGQRHARLLEELGVNTAIVSRRRLDDRESFAGLPEAVSAHKPELVVIANETSEHYSALAELGELGFAGSVLVEKPLFADLRPIPENNFRNL